jgi:hypothetical protein
MGAGSAALFFVCLIGHELGHAVQARREGMKIEGIAPWLFGGVARFSGMLACVRTAASGRRARRSEPVEAGDVQ